MILLIISAAWAAVVAILLIRAVRQYEHYEVIGPAPESADLPVPSVTVIIPARNEAANIECCVNAVTSQRYPRKDLDIIVVDDHSVDETGQLVRRLATRDGRVRLMQSDPLPVGWLGKPHACAQAARAGTGQWLCFLDADTLAEPMLISTAVKTAIRRGADLLSLQPLQKLESFWERLILPCGFFLIAFTQDLRQTNDPSSPRASVNGQFLLIRREAYESTGGHGAVFDQVAEDSALAARIKAGGLKVLVLGTNGLLHTRMYASLGALWQGVARQAGQLLGNQLALLLASIAALTLSALAVALPTTDLATVTRRPDYVHVAAFTLALAGSLALLGTHIGAAKYFRIPFWYGFLFPLGYCVGAAVLLYASWQKSGGGVRWKGRVYPAPAESKVPPDARVVQ
jgi:chlorobactene glucosyltransferase